MFLDSDTKKWRATETTFLKYYYFPDPHLETRYFIGASRADVDHRQYGIRGDRILMIGRPSQAQIILEEEHLLGDQKQIAKIKGAVQEIIDYNRFHYRQSETEWYQDEKGYLIKVKTNDPDEKNKEEPFERQM